MKIIKITLTMNEKGGSRQRTTIALIRDGLCLTKFSDPHQAQQTFAALKQQGKDCAFTKGIVTEWFANKTKDQIADKMEREIIGLKKQFRGQFKIKHTRVEVEK
jgi:hypothetical protein